MGIGRLLFGIVAAAALAPAGAQAGEAVDVRRYDLEVGIRPDVLAVSVAIHASGKPPSKWVLELAPEVRVLSADSSGKPIPFSASGRSLTLDLAGVSSATDGAFAVNIRCEGAPSERFSKDRGGYVRSAVGPGLVHVRSQVPWYPRAADDPAIHRVVVDAPAAWQVRSAGSFSAPVTKGDRATWTFETSGPVDRAGLAAGPWKVRASGDFDALVSPGREEGADGLLPLAKRAVEFHSTDLGPLSRRRYSLVEMPREFGEGSGYSECGYILLGPGAFEAGPGADWVPGFLAHEAAHQWWGQDGLFSDFANEGLAEFSRYRFLRAEKGAPAADAVRRAALQRVAAAAADGKAVPLSAIRGWGGGMDAGTYDVHAYAKTLLLLAAVEDAIGQEAMQALLRRFLDGARKARAGWAGIRAALCAEGPKAKEAVERWEKPGLPEGAAPPSRDAGAKTSLEAAMKVANGPGESDPRTLETAIADLRAARESADLSDGEKAEARTGIGRCLFRLGKLDEAGKELKAALEAGAGGPFHRGWAHLRLGCIADLKGRRKEAMEHYRAVVDAAGSSKTAVEKAKAFLGKPYRGYAKDG